MADIKVQQRPHPQPQPQSPPSPPPTSSAPVRLNSPSVVSTNENTTSSGTNINYNNNNSIAVPTTTNTSLPSFEQTRKNIHDHNRPNLASQMNSTQLPGVAKLVSSSQDSINHTDPKNYTQLYSTPVFKAKLGNVNGNGNVFGDSSASTSTVNSPNYRIIGRGPDDILTSLPTPPTKVKDEEDVEEEEQEEKQKQKQKEEVEEKEKQQKQRQPNASIQLQKQQSLSQNDSSEEKMSSPVCRNCQTQTTPLWRRDETGQVLCNACGLFLKLHGRPRPISLKTDTIKSRNRVKHSGAGGNSNSGSNTNNSQSQSQSQHHHHQSASSAKTSGANTPELKSKDSRDAKESKSKKQTSPKLKKFKSGNKSDLTPLLPNTNKESYHHNHPSLSSTTTTTTTTASSSSSALPVNMGMQNHHLMHSQVPLHYPSSTPAQFAPGLRRITSPLLLSSPAVKNEADHQLNSLQAAAGVLENLSNSSNMSNELGPNATFKGGVSLLNKKGNKPYQQYSKNGSGSLFGAVPTTTSTTGTPAPHLPRLPPLNKNSPVFGGVNGDHNGHTSNGISRASTPTLPPLHEMANGQSTSGNAGVSKPFDSLSMSMHSNGATNQTSNNQGTQNSSNSFNNGNNDNRSSINSNNNNTNNGNNTFQQQQQQQAPPPPPPPPSSNQTFTSTHEITLLKTRISELELVNDLYRTRIMELEAMEQAARLRENSMRKRLDEVMNLQASTLLQHQQHQQQQHQQQQQQRLEEQAVDSTSPNHQPHQSQLPSFQNKSGTTPASYNHQNEYGVMLAPLKRDHEGNTIDKRKNIS